jgi:hypothetical protein
MIKLNNLGLIFLSFAVIAVPACDSVSDPDFEAKDFFPLIVGNKWTYHTYSNVDISNYTSYHEIKGIKEINGKLYYTLTVNIPERQEEDSLYYRCSGDTLFCINEYTMNEEVIADFSQQLNDTCWWDKHLVVTEKTKDTFTASSEFLADYGYSISFKRGTGIISTVSNGFVYYKTTLVSADIKYYNIIGEK